MAIDIYGELKRSLTAKVNQIAEQNISTIGDVVDGSNIPEMELKKAFNNIINVRNSLFEETDKLIDIRANLYQNVISMLYLTDYFNDVEKSVHEVSAWFDILEFVKSTSFSNMLRNVLQDISRLGDLSQEIRKLRATEYRAYFSERYEKLRLLLLPNKNIKVIYDDDDINHELILVKENEDNTTKKLEIIDSDQPENYILYMLGYLGKVKNTEYFSKTTEININFFSTVANGLEYLSSAKISGNITSIRYNLKRFVILDNYRVENDSSYNGEYLAEIIEKLEIYEYNISLLNEIINKPIKEVKEDENYSIFTTSAQEIRNDINTLLDELITSIIETNNFFDQYSMFLKLPEDTIKNIDRSINTILPSFKESIKSENKEYFPSNYNPNINIKKFISEYMALTQEVEEKTINVIQFKDRTNLILLYLGLELLEKNKNYTNFNYINYPLRTLATRSIIIDSQIDNTFTKMKELEEELADKYGIRVQKNINIDLIPSSVKTLFPKLRLLDHIDISITLDYDIGYGYNNIELVKKINDNKFYNLATGKLYIYNDLTEEWVENDDEIVEFMNTLYGSVLDAVLSKKDELIKSLPKLMEVYKTFGTSYKAIFFEMILYKVLQDLNQYKVLQDLNQFIFPFTDVVSKEINNYLESDKVRESQKILANYREIRELFYTSNRNVAGEILKTDSILYNKIFNIQEDE